MSRETPSQTAGPFIHIGFEFAGSERLVPPDAPGAIGIEGRIVDGEGAPVADAIVEIWQADARGIYPHPEDPRHDEADPDFIGFGRSSCDEDGMFRLVTLKPGRVPGPGNTLQAPHICLSIFARGLLDRLVTRLYFEDEAQANDEDPVLGRLEDEALRATLIARRSQHGGRSVYRLDIRLQGEGETVFFDL